MIGCSNNKIIKLLLIPSEDEFIKKSPHIFQVHMIFFFIFSLRKVMAPLLFIISSEKIFMWLWPCFVLFCFIYTNDEEVCILNRPTYKIAITLYQHSPKQNLARPVRCYLFKAGDSGCKIIITFHWHIVWQQCKTLPDTIVKEAQLVSPLRATQW